MENESGFYEIENLEIVIDTETDKAVKGLDRFHKMLEKLDSKIKGSKLSEFCSHLQTIASTDLSKTASDMERIATAQERLAAIKSHALETVQSLGTGMPKTAGKVSRVKATSDLTFTQGVNELERYDTVLNKLNRPEATAGLQRLHERLRNISSVNLQKQANALERIVKASGQVDLRRVKKAAGEKATPDRENDTPSEKKLPQPTKLTELWQKVKATNKLLHEYNSLGEKARHIQTAWKGANDEWSKTHDVMDKTQKKANSMSLGKAIKTILLYNVLFSALNAITTGIKEGLDNITRASKEANAVMTDYKTTTLQMKNALGAAAIPVLKALHPLYQMLADAIIDVANAVNLLTASAQGAKSYTRAKKYVEDYVKALQKAKGLLGMDEINTMGKSLNYSDMFETVEIDGSSTLKAIGHLSTFLGLVVSIGAAKKAFSAFFMGTGAISKWGGVVGLAALGAGLLATSIIDILRNGKSLENTLQNCFGILAIGGAVALAMGSWIPLAIAAVVAGLAAIVIWGDEIVFGLDKLEFKWGSVLDKARLKVNEFFDNLVEKTKGHSPHLARSLELVKEYALMYVNWFETLTDGCIRRVRNFVGIVSSLFSGDLKGALEFTKPYFLDYWKSFANMAIAPINFVSGFFESFVNFFIRGINKLIETANRVTGLFGGEKLQIELIQEVDWKGISAFEFDNKYESLYNKYESLYNSKRIPTRTRSVTDSLNQQALGAIRDLNERAAVAAYATGGFPEDGLFLANHTELIGKFAGGKTAVANNEQIIEGIARGVASASSEQNSLLREQNRLLAEIAGKEAVAAVSVSTITKAQNRQSRRAGRAVVAANG